MVPAVKLSRRLRVSTLNRSLAGMTPLADSSTLMP
jgi:hypothetical protein